MTGSLVPNQQRVLVADDERIIADTLQTILSKHSFEVIVEKSGFPHLGTPTSSGRITGNTEVRRS